MTQGPRVTTSRRAIVSGAYHHHLVTDLARVQAYRQAINALVRAGDTVADLGTGSGLLSGFAAQAGARRVYSVDADEHARDAAAGFAKRNGFSEIMRVIPGDAETWVPPEPVDVIVCEMIETGLMNEEQRRVMNHVASAWPKPRSIIPGAMTLAIALVDAAEDHHGLRVLLPHFERDPKPAYQLLTDTVTYHEADLTTTGPTRVDETITLTGTETGRANAAVLLTATHLGAGITAQPSSDHASPLVLPLEEDITVTRGTTFRLRVSYAFGTVTGRISVAPA